jgi:hypothetical protein
VRQCAVGLSGVVFGLIVADNAASRATHRSIFGCAALQTPVNTRHRRRCGWGPLQTEEGAVLQLSCGHDRVKDANHTKPVHTS